MARNAKKSKSPRRATRRPTPTGTMVAGIEDIRLDARHSPETRAQPTLVVLIQLRLADSFRTLRCAGLVIHEAAIGESRPCTRNIDMIEALVKAAGKPPLADFTTENLRAALGGLVVFATLGQIETHAGPIATVEDITIAPEADQ